MIAWMSKDVDELWDKANSDGLFLVGLICDIHPNCKTLRGHVIIQLECVAYFTDFTYQLDLGDCTGLSDKEINDRFIRRFPNFVKAYGDFNDCVFTILESLQELSDKFLATIG